MRTKTFSAKRLLSLVLTVAMFATMILPTGVFAADNRTFKCQRFQRIMPAPFYQAAAYKRHVGYAV